MLPVHSAPRASAWTSQVQMNSPQKSTTSLQGRLDATSSAVTCRHITYMKLPLNKKKPKTNKETKTSEIFVKVNGNQWFQGYLEERKHRGLSWRHSTFIHTLFPKITESLQPHKDIAAFPVRLGWIALMPPPRQMQLKPEVLLAEITA